MARKLQENFEIKISKTTNADPIDKCGDSSSDDPESSSSEDDVPLDSEDDVSSDSEEEKAARSVVLQDQLKVIQLQKKILDLQNAGKAKKKLKGRKTTLKTKGTIVATVGILDTTLASHSDSQKEREAKLVVLQDQLKALLEQPKMLIEKNTAKAKNKLKIRKAILNTKGTPVAKVETFDTTLPSGTSLQSAQPSHKGPKKSATSTTAAAPAKKQKTQQIKKE